jgi:WD40 repeat protein
MSPSLENFHTNTDQFFRRIISRRGTFPPTENSNLEVQLLPRFLQTSLEESKFLPIINGLGSPKYSAMSAGCERVVTQVWAYGPKATIVWDAETGDYWKLDLPAPTDMQALAFSPDGKWLATGSPSSQKQAVRVWNTKKRTSNALPNRSQSEWYRHFSFAPDSRYVVGCSSQGTACMWSVEKRLTCFPIPVDHAYVCAFSSDNKYIAFGRSCCALRIYSPSTGSYRDLETKCDSPNPVSIAWSPGGQYVALGCKMSSMHVWHVQKRVEYRCKIGKEYSTAYSIAFSPESTLIASGHDSSIRVWNADTGLLIYEFKGHNHKVDAIAFSRRENLVISVGGDIRVWKLP